MRPGGGIESDTQFWAMREGFGVLTLFYYFKCPIHIAREGGLVPEIAPRIARRVGAWSMVARTGSTLRTLSKGLTVYVRSFIESRWSTQPM